MRPLRLSALALATLAALVIPAPTRAAGELETIALALLAQKFGIGQQQAQRLQTLTNRSVFETAPVYSTSHYTHRSVDEVWRLRQQGLGWGQVARRLGMSPGRFNKLRTSGAFDSDAIWTSICKERYGASGSDLAAIRRRGGSMRDALSASIIARASHRSPVVVYKRYQSDRDWGRTARTYKVDLRNHAKYARPIGKAVRSQPTRVGTRSGVGHGAAQYRSRSHRGAPDAGLGNRNSDREGKARSGGKGRSSGGGKGGAKRAR